MILTPLPPPSHLENGRVAGLRIAHVGYTGSDDDRDRRLAARLWLRRSGLSALEAVMAGGGAVEDLIDLNGDPARDFLRERHRYDIVVTHNLPPLTMPAAAAGTGACSALHASGEWCRRLWQSGAYLVFMFGSHCNAISADIRLPAHIFLHVPAAPPVTILVHEQLAGAKPSRRAISREDMVKLRLDNLSALQANEALELGGGTLDGHHIETMAAMPALAHLRLTGTNVTDADLARLACLRHLETLELDETAITDGALRSIGRMAGLKRLSLNDTTLSAAGLHELRTLRHLEWLSLVGTRIADAAIADLAALAALRWLSLTGTRLSRDAVRTLRQKLPACAVEAEDDDSLDPSSTFALSEG